MGRERLYRDPDYVLPLTNRQLEILEIVARGCTSFEDIARVANISPKTVRTHLTGRSKWGKLAYLKDWGLNHLQTKDINTN